MFLGMAFTYTLDLHHAYQPIYLDENTNADHIADLKEEPQGKLRVLVQVLPIATLNIASKFVDIKHNLFTGAYFDEVWVMLIDGILYFYPSNYTHSDSYLKKVDCRKIVKVKETLFELSSLPMAGVNITLESGSTVQLGWTRDEKWPRKLWLRGLKLKYDDTSMYTSRWTPSPKSSREFIGTPRLGYSEYDDTYIDTDGMTDVVTPTNNERSATMDEKHDYLQSAECTPERIDEIKREVLKIYNKHAPQKVGKMEKLLQKFRGREEEYYDFVRDKYTPAWRKEQQQQQQQQEEQAVGDNTSLRGIFPLERVTEADSSKEEMSMHDIDVKAEANDEVERKVVEEPQEEWTSGHIAASFSQRVLEETSTSIDTSLNPENEADGMSSDAPIVTVSRKEKELFSTSTITTSSDIVPKESFITSQLGM